jgi:hypothetical protein
VSSKGTLCHRSARRGSHLKVLAGAYACLLCLSAVPGRADPNTHAKPRKAPECEVTSGRRALAVGAAVIPGVVVRGAGHYVACEPDTALDLLYLEAAAVATAAVSLTGLATTGASRYVVAPLALGALGGVGLFATSWLADIYGVAAPPGGTGRARSQLKRFGIQTGIRAVYDPLFETHWLVSHGFSVDTGLIWLSPRLDASPDARHRRLALLAERRLFGASAPRDQHASWSVDGRLGVRDFAERQEGFGTTTAELALAGRMDLEHLGPTLEGAFATAELGYAREWHRFDGLPGYSWDALLGRVGFGVYLGHDVVRGESSVAYDHRRDTVAGGMHLPGIAAGYAGYLEHRTELYFGPHWGVAAELAYGSAFVASSYLLFQLPRSRR